MPSMVEPVLELCLSHHDELRSNAVAIVRPFGIVSEEVMLIPSSQLHTMIVNEYHVNSSL